MQLGLCSDYMKVLTKDLTNIGTFAGWNPGRLGFALRTYTKTQEFR